MNRTDKEYWTPCYIQRTSGWPFPLYAMKRMIKIQGQTVNKNNVNEKNDIIVDLRVIDNSFTLPLHIFQFIYLSCLVLIVLVNDLAS